jgi:hypothetical protein
MFILNKTQEFRLLVNVKYHIFCCQDIVKISDPDPGSFPFGKKKLRMRYIRNVPIGNVNPDPEARKLTKSSV